MTSISSTFVLEARIYSLFKGSEYRQVWNIANRLNLPIDDVLDVVYASPSFWIVTGFGSWKFKDPKNYLVKKAVSE